jgi:hypothetical protein
MLALLDHPDSSWQAVKVMLGARRPQPSDYITGSAALCHKLREALARSDFAWFDWKHWPQSDLTTPRWTLQAVAQVRPHPADVEPSLDAAALAAYQARVAEHLLAMDDLTADVLDCIVILWIQHAKHPEDLVSVTADQCLELRGVQKHKGGSGRRGGHSCRQRRQIAQQIGILSDLWISVAEMDVTETVQGKRGPSRQRGEEAAGKPGGDDIKPIGDGDIHQRA